MQIAKLKKRDLIIFCFFLHKCWYFSQFLKEIPIQGCLFPIVKKKQRWKWLHVPVIVVIISATILHCHTLVIKSSRVLFCFQMNLMGKQFWTKTVISTLKPENIFRASVAFSGRAFHFGYYLSWCETSTFWLKILVFWRCF